MIDRLELDVRDSGAWSWVDATPMVSMSRSAVWFDDAGKLHAVVRSNGYPDVAGTAPYIVYLEP